MEVEQLEEAEQELEILMSFALIFGKNLKMLSIEFIT
jgi:hypothetical protein